MSAAELDAAWRELEADALASDGRITDGDVKSAIKRNRPRIEAAAMGNEQYHADGAALRRLREALPAGWTDPLITTQWARISGEMEWSISVQDADAPGCFFHQFGDTIAAAADACREALEAGR